jgi:cytochrome c peroxidase
MRDRVRFSFVQVGLAVLAATPIGLACSRDEPLSDDEMRLLRTFVLSDPPPSDPSNKYEDRVDAAKLGKKLFFEAGFSGELGPYNVADTNGALGSAGERRKVACASCHDPRTAGVDHRSLPNSTSLGVSYTTRNSPSVINAAYSPLWQFWDGRADSLWSQALSPPEGPAECNGTRLGVAHLVFVKYGEEYNAIFAEYPLPDLSNTARFPLEGRPTDDDFKNMNDDDEEVVNRIYVNFGKAIAAYERRLISPAFEKSPFDKFMAGDAEAMSPAAIRGARLFVGRAGCMECHRGPMFTDFTFHNVGAPQTGEHVPPIDRGRSDGIVAIRSDLANERVQYNFTRGTYWSDQPDDTHTAPLLTIVDDTALEPYQGLFKTPTLRNVNKTAPYMHDGAYQTLWDVVNHYNFGGATGPYSGKKDPALAPLLLTDSELGDLVEFLRALDDGAALPTDDFPEGLLEEPPPPSPPSI